MQHELRTKTKNSWSRKKQIKAEEEMEIKIMNVNWKIQYLGTIQLRQERELKKIDKNERRVAM